MTKNKKSKRNQPSKSQNNRVIMAAVLMIAIVGVGLAIFASSSNTATAIAQLTPDDYQDQFSEAPHLLLDVRRPDEFDSGHIAGAINISVETLASRLSEVPDDQTIVVYCRSGNRSATASEILADAGYNDIYDMGGIIDWQNAGYPVE